MMDATALLHNINPYCTHKVKGIKIPLPLASILVHQLNKLMIQLITTLRA